VETRSLVFIADTGMSVGYCWYPTTPGVGKAEIESRLAGDGRKADQWFYNPRMTLGFLDAIAPGWMHAEVKHAEKASAEEILDGSQWSLHFQKDAEMHFWKVYDDKGDLIRLPLRPSKDAVIQTFGKRVGRLLRLSHSWDKASKYRVITLAGTTPVLNGLIVGGDDISQAFGLRTKNGSLTYFDGKNGLYMKGHFQSIPGIPPRTLITSEDNVKFDIEPCDVDFFSVEEVAGKEHVFLDIQTACNLLANDLVDQDILVNWTKEGLAEINKILADPIKLSRFIPEIRDSHDLSIMEQWRLMTFLESGVSPLHFRTLYNDVLRIVRRHYLKYNGEGFARILVPGAKAGYMRPLLYFENGTLYVADFSGYAADANCVYFGASTIGDIQEIMGGGDNDDNINRLPKQTKDILYRNPNDKDEIVVLHRTELSAINKYVKVTDTLRITTTKTVSKPSDALHASFDALRKAINPDNSYEEKLFVSWNKFQRNNASIGAAANAGLARALLGYDARHGGGQRSLLKQLEAARPSLEAIIDLVQKGEAKGADEALKKLRKTQSLLGQYKPHRILRDRFMPQAEVNGTLKNSPADAVFNAVIEVIKDFFNLHKIVAKEIRPPIAWATILPAEPSNGLLDIYFQYNRKIANLLKKEDNVIFDNKEILDGITAIQEETMREIATYTSAFGDAEAGRQFIRKGILSILNRLITGGGADSFILMRDLYPVTLDILREFGVAYTPDIVDESILLPSPENRLLDAIFGTITDDMSVVRKLPDNKVLVAIKGNEVETAKEKGRFRAYIPDNKEYTIKPGANQALIEAGKILIGDDEFIIGDNQKVPADGVYNAVVSPYKLRTGKISKSSVWVTIVTKINGGA
jgi:hypothetical protein